MSIIAPKKTDTTQQPENRIVTFSAEKNSIFKKWARSYTVNLNLEPGNMLIWKISKLTKLKDQIGEYTSTFSSEKWDRFITPLKSSEDNYTDLISMNDISKEQALETSFIHLHDAVLRAVDCICRLLIIPNIANEDDLEKAQIKKGNIPHPLYPATRLGFNEKLEINEEDNLISQISQIFLISPMKIYNLWEPLKIEDFEKILLKVQDQFLGKDFFLSSPPTFCTLDKIRLSITETANPLNLSLKDIKFKLTYTQGEPMEVSSIDEFQANASRETLKIIKFIELRKLSSDFSYVNWDLIANQMFARLDQTHVGKLVFLEDGQLARISEFTTYENGKRYNRTSSIIPNTSSLNLAMKEMLPKYCAKKRIEKFLSNFEISDKLPNLQKLEKRIMELSEFKESTEMTERKGT